MAKRNEENFHGFKFEYVLGETVYHKHGAEDELWEGTVIDVKYHLASDTVEYLIEFGPNTMAWCSTYVLSSVSPNLLK